MRYRQRVIERPPRLAIRIEVGGKTAVAELDAPAADALARELALQATLVDAERLVCMQLGRDFLHLEREVAQAIARYLVRGKLRLEELAQAQRIARDSAILLRAGANFALSSDARIIEAAKTEAAFGDIRRYMPGGVKSREAFGTPRIVQHPPKGATA